MNIVQAGIGDLVPVVVFVVFIIAQLSKAKNKSPKRSPFENQNRSPLADQTGPSSTAPAEDSFENLIRKLADTQAPTPPAYEPKPVQPAPMQTAPAPNIEKVEQPAQGKPAIKKRSSRNPIKAKPIAQEPKEIADMTARPSMRAFRNSLPPMKLPTVKLPTIKLNFQSSTRHNHDMDSDRKDSVRNRLGYNDPETFRRAMINHIILGTPKGLEGME